jgi:hypothetical protein
MLGVRIWELRKRMESGAAKVIIPVHYPGWAPEAREPVTTGSRHRPNSGARVSPPPQDRWVSVFDARRRVVSAKAIKKGHEGT